MKIFFVLFALMSNAFAQDFYCTEWTRQQGISCIFAGRSADVWARQCENLCQTRWNWGPHCDLDRICLNENPNLLLASCSEWVRESGMTCHNPNTGRWEQKWVRACQTGLATVWCSDKNPNRN